MISNKGAVFLNSLNLAPKKDTLKLIQFDFNEY